MSDLNKKEFKMSIAASSYNLYGKRFGNGVLNAISQSEKAPDNEVVLNSGRAGLVRYPHPLAIDHVYALKDISGHHSSCIQAKKYATVGLGFIDGSEDIEKAKDEQEAMQMAQTLLTGQGKIESKVDEALDPFTYFGFFNELVDACEDFMDTGTGYLEVARNAAGQITGISHIPAKDIWFCSFKGRVFFQYQPLGNGAPATKYWALFGKKNKEWLLSGDGPFMNGTLKPEDVSEIIPFIQPSNRVKFYGYPDWISASVDIDMLKKSKQYKTDFYHNRGVLDKILTVTGVQVDSEDWDAIKAAIKSSQGMGNNFNSLALNFANPEAVVDVKNMGADGSTEEQFAKDMETLTQNIVSSHGVPPLLANILIPGKLGASNEFINALIGFQLLRINAYQNVFEKMLAKTLGGPDGVDGLAPDDFRLRTITSQIDLNTMDAVGRSRSEAMSGENKDRDYSDGVKE